MLNGHGDDIYSSETKVVSNFSSNIYNNQDLSALQSYLCSRIQSIHSYPEPDAHSLVRLLAEKKEIESTNILTTNGAVEAIYLLAQAFTKSKSSIIIPTFSEYEDACTINKHKLSFLTSLSELKNSTDLVWMCNPNNPDGKVYDKEYLNKFIQEHPKTYFIIDQSYEAFTDICCTFTAKEALKFNNLVLLHSMTKQYTIPGLRLGYIISNKDLINSITSLRMPWSVNQLAIEAGKFLLENGKTNLDIKTYLTETQRLIGQLNSIEGLHVLPTRTHFFLCKLINKNASDLKQYLRENYGILIRDASNFRGLSDSHFRIATQSRNENDILVKVLKEWI